MRSRYHVFESDGVYFITSTVVEWIPVFTGTPYCDMLLESLRFCREHKGLRLYAYVILENHLHLVCEAPDLVAVMQSFKRHTAHEVIRTLESMNRGWLLNQLAYYKKSWKSESKYQLWQEGVHPQLIQGAAMLCQKIEYIHNNPVCRGYVDLPEHWRYSSARNYEHDDNSVLEIDPLPL